MNDFKFSQRSVKKLKSVNKYLKGIMYDLLSHSPHDFAITEGLRTLEKQKKLLSENKTKTLQSKHLDGLAVDIVALPNGKVSWEPQHYVEIANALNDVLRLSNNQKYLVRWGGAWNCYMPCPMCAEEMVQSYKKFCADTNKKPFHDYVHIELVERRK